MSNSRKPVRSYRRQCVYAEDRDLSKLKKLLAKRDVTLAQWFRQKVREELADEESK